MFKQPIFHLMFIWSMAIQLSPLSKCDTEHDQHFKKRKEISGDSSFSSLLPFLSVHAETFICITCTNMILLVH